MTKELNSKGCIMLSNAVIPMTWMKVNIIRSVQETLVY